MDISATIQSQYSTSPKIMALAQSFADLIDAAPDAQLFYDKVFNLETAQGVGLDIWGRIVGLERSAEMVTEYGVKYFGFSSKAAPNATGFNNDPFYHGADQVKFELSDDAYRLFLRTKAMANISTGSLADLNRMLHQLLPGRDVAIYRAGPMHLKLICAGELTDYERNMLLQGDLPPIPAGVTLEVELNGAKYFGFNSESNTPFNQGPLYQRPGTTA